MFWESIVEVRLSIYASVLTVPFFGLDILAIRKKSNENKETCLFGASLASLEECMSLDSLECVSLDSQRE